MVALVHGDHEQRVRAVDAGLLETVEERREALVPFLELRLVACLSRAKGVAFVAVRVIVVHVGDVRHRHGDVVFLHRRDVAERLRGRGVESGEASVAVRVSYRLRGGVAGDRRVVVVDVRHRRCDARHLAAFEFRRGGGRRVGLTREEWVHRDRAEEPVEAFVPAGLVGELVGNAAVFGRAGAAGQAARERAVDRDALEIRRRDLRVRDRALRGLDPGRPVLKDARDVAVRPGARVLQLDVRVREGADRAPRACERRPWRRRVLLLCRDHVRQPVFGRVRPICECLLEVGRVARAVELLVGVRDVDPVAAGVEPRGGAHEPTRGVRDQDRVIVGEQRSVLCHKRVQRRHLFDVRWHVRIVAPQVHVVELQPHDVVIRGIGEITAGGRGCRRASSREHRRGHRRRANRRQNRCFTLAAEHRDSPFLALKFLAENRRQGTRERRSGCDGAVTDR